MRGSVCGEHASFVCAVMMMMMMIGGLQCPQGWGSLRLSQRLPNLMHTRAQETGTRYVNSLCDASTSGQVVHSFQVSSEQCRVERSRDKNNPPLTLSVLHPMQ